MRKNLLGLTRVIHAYMADLFTKTKSPAQEMTHIVLLGSFVITALLLLLLAISLFTLGHAYVLIRIFAGFTALLYLCVVSIFVRKNQLKTAAWMIIGLYGFAGFAILHFWGLNAPIGILTLGFVVILAAVMLGVHYIIPTAIGVVCFLLLTQYLSVIGLSQPDRSMLDNESTYGDVASYSVVLSIFTLITWLFGRKTQRTLKRAVIAETELQHERDSLVDRVETQKNELIRAQRKELDQLYTFAELGQLTSIMLHELANHLSVLTLDIDDIKDRHESSNAIKNAKESISYIDGLIEQVRNQIKNSNVAKKFNAYAVSVATVAHLRTNLKNVTIKLVHRNKKDTFDVFGDPLRLSQAITILVNNAAQASRKGFDTIVIDVKSDRHLVTISVKDFGTGISEHARKHLFQPQKSEKGGGLGIGLHITKQIIDTHFKGTLSLSSATEYTMFRMKIPKYTAKNARTSPAPQRLAASTPKTQ